MAKKKSTYGTIAKWFKWSSLIIILIPVVELVLYAIALAKAKSTDVWSVGAWFDLGIQSLVIIGIVAALAWLVLNIIMFCAAGTVRGEGPSPLKIRLGLLASMILVVGPTILAIVAAWFYGNNLDVQKWAYWLGILAPIFGYIIGSLMGSSLQHNLN